MKITLTPEIERALVDEARRLGVTPEQLALDSLRERFAPEDIGNRDIGKESAGERQGRTLYDSLKENGLLGCLDSSEHIPGGAQMAENSHEKFVEILLEKRRQGKL